MRFVIENFGPVERADILLKNLNVFTGKNSSGKSCLIYLIWALLSVEPDWEELVALFEEYIPNELMEELMGKESNALRESSKKDKPDTRKLVEKHRNLNDELAKRFKNLIFEVFKRFDDIWGRNLESLFKDAFLVDSLSELVRKGCERSGITVSNNRGDRKINIEIGENLISWIDKEVLNDIEKNLHVTVTGGEAIKLTLQYHDTGDYKEYTIFFTQKYRAVEIMPVTFTWIFDGYCPYSSTFIAPDGRTGLIRSLEAYNYALIGGKVTINGVDRYFMRDYISFSPKIVNEEISRFAEFIEEKLDVKFFLKREQPKYTIQVGELEIPLQRAPSGYRELAPITYAMRYRLDRDYTIFVEEPEAHLHPDGEVVAIRALAGLSDYCHVVLTTHSITILDEISNLLKLKNIPAEEKVKIGYEKWEGLSPENTGIFLVRDGKVEEIEVYEDGIEETDLDKITIEIANIHAEVEAEYERSRKMQTQ